MTPTLEPERALRVARQLVETSRLLGSDFVPCRRASTVPGERPDEPPLDPPPVAAPRVEVRPVRHPAGAASSSAAELTEIVSGGGVGGSLLPGPVFQRLPREAGESEREYAARLLENLRRRYEQDAPHRHFVTAHTHIVFGEGDPRARLCFVGEAPGEEEDKTGRPFVGRAGQLLDKMIVAMGLRREEVYICNVLKTRPPNNATPTTRETERCEPYLLEQLSIVSPEVVVTLGLPATRTCLKVEDSMSRLRGRWSRLNLPDGRALAVMPTYHPAFLLRSYTPENRGKVWSDLRMAMEKLGLQSPNESAVSA